MVGTTSGLGGFMSGASIRFSKLKSGTGGADAWRDSLAQAQRSGDRRPKTAGTALPKLNSIHKATVVSMQAFGAFVQLGDGNTYRDGLLHVSCLGAERYESPEEAGLKQNMQLWVKVSEIKEDDMKYGVDIRYVSQRDGADLDPYNTKGRLPNNLFEGGRPKADAPAAPAAAQLAGHARPPAGDDEAVAKRRAIAEAFSDSDDGDSDSSGSTVDSDARHKLGKKLEKAKKKLEKARKSAEKAKGKLEKAKRQRTKKNAKGSHFSGAS